MYKQSVNRGVRFIFVVFVIIFIYFLVKFSVIYLYPFLIAAFFAFMLNPIVTFLEKKGRIPRTLATILVIVSAFVLIFGIIIIIISELIQGTTFLAEKLPSHFNTLITFAEEFINTEIIPIYHKLTSLFHTLNPAQQEIISEHIQMMAEQISTSGSTLLHNLLLTIPMALSVLPNSVTIFIVVILATFLITKDWHTLKQTIKKIIPTSASDTSRNVGDHLKRAIEGFFKAQLILIMLTGITILVGLYILDIEHALTIAMIAAVIDLLPYIGTGIIFIPWIIFLFITENYPLTIGLAILYMVIIVGRQIIEPKLLSSTIGINPLLALITLFLGLQILGVLGLLVAPLIMILISALYQSGVMKEIWQFIKM